jgi:hypothetical protein
LEKVRRIDSRQGPGYWEELIERADGSRYAICSYEDNVVSFFSIHSFGYSTRRHSGYVPPDQVVSRGLDKIVLPGGERIPINAWARIE